MIEYDHLQKSLKLLEEQNLRLKTLDDGHPDWVIEAVKESVIQRFEVCWDNLWKVLKRYLIEEASLPDVPNGPKHIIRLAGVNEILPSPTEQWLGYVEARNSTSHTYSRKKAEIALKMMDDFVGDAINLYQFMSGETWK